MDATTFATAYGLSTSAGIRPFLTLAFASLAMHFGYLHPAHAFAFLGSDGATLALLGFAAVEFVADKVPGVDHVLHVLHIAVKPVAAAMLVGSAVPATGVAPDAMMGVAALNALGVHGGVSALRGASSMLTLGFANPLVSVLEDVSVLGATGLAFFLPFAGAGLALAITLLLFVIARAIVRSVRARREVGGYRIARGATVTR